MLVIICESKLCSNKQKVLRDAHKVSRNTLHLGVYIYSGYDPHVTGTFSITVLNISFGGFFFFIEKNIYLQLYFMGNIYQFAENILGALVRF